MSNGKLWIGAALAAMAVSAVVTSPAHAEPLTPLTPQELQYLDGARRVLTVSGDPLAFRSDGDLLVSGRFACDKRAAGLVGYEATLVAPAITQLAFIYLCP